MDLTLRNNNLFRNGEIVVFDNSNEILLLRELVLLEGTLQDGYHTVLKNDRLDVLAYNNYKNSVSDSSKYWWVIADANNIDNPLDLTELVGTEILIPNILNVKLKLE